jgi:hypothetical protein
MKKYFIFLYKKQGIGDNNNRGKENSTTEATMATFQSEELLIKEYERRLQQSAGSLETTITYKWIMVATIQGDRELHTPGEIEVSEEEQEALHEIFRKAREARKAAQLQKGAN